MEAVDLLVIGAGLRGMNTALSRRRHQPDARVLVVDRKPWPGDDVQSQRSNGFVCELGPFAFADTELAPHLELLARPPRVVAARPRTGWLFDGHERIEAAVEPPPCSFPTGCEELVQAYRRELDGSLRLGREVVRIEPDESGAIACELGGEVPQRVVARQVSVAIAPAAAAPLLAAFDPRLAEVAGDVRRQRRAFVFLGGLASETTGLTGYGVLPTEGLDTPLAEAIFCSEVFERRALDGRSLVRVELTAAPDLDDTALVALATAELRRCTGTNATFPFAKVHRFDVRDADGAAVECRVRLEDLAARLPALEIAR